ALVVVDQTYSPGLQLLIDLLRHGAHPPGLKQERHQTWGASKIRQLGLDSLVDAWVISEEVGIRKPLPGIFHALAARLECPLDGWMIGDSLELDVVGGAAVGLRTALISGAEPTQDGAHADLLVASVAEAAEAIMSDAT
ncbi:HAD hydrolase-like protein, partial [Nocardioides sp. SOB44]